MFRIVRIAVSHREHARSSTLIILPSQILAFIIAILLISAKTSAQENPEKKTAVEKPANVERLSEEQLNKILNTRLDGDLGFTFKEFSNMFLVSSYINLGSGVGLMTESEKIAEAELQPIYPTSYRPTMREFLDRIALQSSATWKNDPTGKFIKNEADDGKPAKNLAIFEFVENKQTNKPYELTLEKGWKTVDHGHWVMHVPEVFPIGLDIYQMGTYTPDNGEVTPDFLNKTLIEISLSWAQRVQPETKSNELIPAKVGKYEALYFESMIPSKMNKEIKWRQWVFFVDSEAYFIVSTILPEFEDKIFPDVSKMIATFKKRELQEGEANQLPANPDTKPKDK